jgi:AcrR family transcriptional regulator
MNDTPDIAQRCQHAFLSLLEQQTFSAMRMADVAKLANTSRPTLYRHFHSKEQLFRASVDELFDQFYDQAEPYLEQFEDSLSLVVNFLASSVAFQQRALIQTLLSSGADDLFISQLRKYFARLLGTLLRQKEIKPIRQSDVDIITSMLAGACFYCLKEWENNGMQQSPKQMAKVLAHLFNGQLLSLIETDQNPLSPQASPK